MSTYKLISNPAVAANQLSPAAPPVVALVSRLAAGARTVMLEQAALLLHIRLIDVSGATLNRFCANCRSWETVGRLSNTREDWLIAAGDRRFAVWQSRDVSIHRLNHQQFDAVRVLATYAPTLPDGPHQYGQCAAKPLQLKR